MHDLPSISSDAQKIGCGEKVNFCGILFFIIHVKNGGGINASCFYVPDPQHIAGDCIFQGE